MVTNRVRFQSSPGAQRADEGLHMYVCMYIHTVLCHLIIQFYVFSICSTLFHVNDERLSSFFLRLLTSCTYIQPSEMVYYLDIIHKSTEFEVTMIHTIQRQLCSGHGEKPFSYNFRETGTSFLVVHLETAQPLPLILRGIVARTK